VALTCAGLITNEGTSTSGSKKFCNHNEENNQKGILAMKSSFKESTDTSGTALSCASDSGQKKYKVLLDCLFIHHVKNKPAKPSCYQ
jgi:hypothetical protein